MFILHYDFQYIITHFLYETKMTIIYNVKDRVYSKFLNKTVTGLITSKNMDLLEIGHLEYKDKTLEDIDPEQRIYVFDYDRSSISQDGFFFEVTPFQTSPPQLIIILGSFAFGLIYIFM